MRIYRLTFEEIDDTDKSNRDTNNRVQVQYQISDTDLRYVGIENLDYIKKRLLEELENKIILNHFNKNKHNLNLEFQC